MTTAVSKGYISSLTCTFYHPSTLNPPPQKKISPSLSQKPLYIYIYIPPKMRGVCGGTVIDITGLITERRHQRRPSTYRLQGWPSYLTSPSLSPLLPWGGPLGPLFGPRKIPRTPTPEYKDSPTKKTMLPHRSRTLPISLRGRRRP